MSLARTIRAALARPWPLVGAALLLATASPAAPAKQNWTTALRTTPEGTHILGNPDAKVKLTEYVSYSCPHCAHFNAESEATLRLGFVATGDGSVEVASFIRNPIDMAASLLVDCAAPTQTIRLHDIILNSQTQWMARFAEVNDTQRARWENGPMPARMRAIATDLDFYRLAEMVGIDHVRADHCLEDDSAMKRLAALTQSAENNGVDSTPSFAIDGVVLAGTHDWQSLKLQLQARTMNR